MDSMKKIYTVLLLAVVVRNIVQMEECEITIEEKWTNSMFHKFVIKREIWKNQSIQEDIMRHIRDQKWDKIKRRLLCRKDNNKKKHSEEGNKKNMSINFGWWNNKTAQGQLGRNTKDSIAMVLDKYKLDVLGISESNILNSDEPSQLKIKGYTLINDKLLKYGRSRCSAYIKDKFRYKIREDIMDEDTSEVWVEILSKNKARSDNMIFGTFYREQAEVRGSKAREGSELVQKQKVRLSNWTEKVITKILTENKSIVFGGDFNAEIADKNNKGDKFGEILEDQLIGEGGLELIMKEKTHQSIRNNKNCAARAIDHIYCDIPNRAQNTRAVDEPGSHHKLILTTIRGRVDHKGPTQHMARERS